MKSTRAYDPPSTTSGAIAMRNDVHFPPGPNDPQPGEPTRPTTNGPPRGRSTIRPGELTHHHRPDRAHSLEKSSDVPASGPLYETPEDRGGIDSTTLSIVVVVIVTVLLAIVFWTVFRSTGPTPTLTPSGETVPNATTIDDAPPPADAPAATE